MTNLTMLTILDKNEIKSVKHMKKPSHTKSDIKKVTSDIEDKNSENYIPKSYRSQSKLGILATEWMAKYLRVKFLQPIKWQNAILIFAIHFISFYKIFTYKLGSVCWQTYFWGNFILK